LFRRTDCLKFIPVARRFPTPSNAFLVTLGVLLALLHAVLALTAAASKSMTADEIAHLTAGLAYSTRGDYRMQPENGNLPQRLAAVPMSLAGVPLPPTTLPSWPAADMWNYGHAFFFERGLAADEWLFLGRGMIALVSAATGLLVFFWSRALFGWRGAFLSLTLFVFCPAFLAHGGLATSDVVMAFFFLAAVGTWWRHLERPGAGGAALSAAILGLACVAKFSAVLLAPMFALTALGWLAGRMKADGWRAPVRRLARSAAVHLLVVWATIWLFYGFRYGAFSPEVAGGARFYRGGWDWILADIGWPRPILVAARDWHMLPEAFLYGFAFVVQFAKERGAFFNGDYSLTGWVSFFPFTFLVKTTLPLLLLLAAGTAAAARVSWERLKADHVAEVCARLRPLTPLAALFVVYWGTSLASHLNIGHRHILPTYPVLFIAAGWLVRWFDSRRPLAASLVVALTVWHAGESLRARPNYLAYFNQLVGGSVNGWRHLVDSSLDWGQDLPALKVWIDTHAPKQRVFLSYFGAGDPAYEGIVSTALPTLPDVGPPRKWHPLTAGVYAISATMLQQAYSPVRGDWTLAREKEFQTLRALEPTLLAFQNDPVRRAALLRDAPESNWTTAWKRYEWLRLARLCYCLRPRRADGEAGYSILIYRLSAEEVAAATGGSLKDWSALIERSIAARDSGT
jgi:hypothetical protein